MLIMPQYVIHENHGPWKYTSIHLSTCSYAKAPNTNTLNTQWYGPFDSYDNARLEAKKLGYHTHKDCSLCTRQANWKSEVEKGG
jgi:hypothetical protein